METIEEAIRKEVLRNLKENETVKKKIQPQAFKKLTVDKLDEAINKMEESELRCSETINLVDLERPLIYSKLK